ncbi:DUF1775 domain-containing protein [Dactylosporangium darangshiense]|uniref:YncI copper-binding domain-containing protein n=1 Tax=Dactylosporangium darangshiense TaxID=579108 RepID=A0ABP8D8D2_9ACTN
MLIRRTAGSVLAVAAVTIAVVLSTALPAAAHVEVKADKAQAGATNVTITFSAENESSKASITSVEVALPAGIAPADVTYVSGPTGWALTPTASGYKVAGPGLAAKQNAEYAVKVAKLPDAKTVSFKTLVNYSDGRVDRWIELPDAGAGSDNPAPTLALAPAAAPASSAAPSTAAASSAAPVETTATAIAADGDGGSSAPLFIGLAVVVVAILAGVVIWRVRRTS